MSGCPSTASKQLTVIYQSLADIPPGQTSPPHAVQKQLPVDCVPSEADEAHSLVLRRPTHQQWSSTTHHHRWKPRHSIAQTYRSPISGCPLCRQRPVRVDCVSSRVASRVGPRRFVVATLQDARAKEGNRATQRLHQQVACCRIAGVWSFLECGFTEERNSRYKPPLAVVTPTHPPQPPTPAALWLRLDATAVRRRVCRPLFVYQPVGNRTAHQLRQDRAALSARQETSAQLRPRF